jgi:hypothetical protein
VSPDHRAFLDRALDAAGQWARFADPKALGVLVILGLGLSDLLSHARATLSSSDVPGDGCDVIISVSGQGCDQTGAVVAFLLAGLFAIATVLFVTGALFPRLRLPRRRSGGPSAKKSLFYFEDVAGFESPAEYEREIRKATADDLESDIAAQVFAVATVASLKHRYTLRAYGSVLGFLASWAATRILLSLAT